MENRSFQNSKLGVDETGNVAFDKDKYGQVCVWPATTLENSEKDIQDFEEFFKTTLQADVIFLEMIETAPDKDKFGNNIPDTGGRPDIIFAVNFDNTAKTFPLRRMRYDIRWIEDAMGQWNNYDSNPIYPERFKHYKTW